MFMGLPISEVKESKQLIKFALWITFAKDVEEKQFCSTA
jgi:hypothetical protein